MQYKRNTYETAEFKPAYPRRGLWVGIGLVLVGLVMGLVAVWFRGDIEFTDAQQTVVFVGSFGMSLVGAGAGWHCRGEYRDGE
jgi:hypothetical protein